MYTTGFRCSTNIGLVMMYILVIIRLLYSTARPSAQPSHFLVYTLRPLVVMHVFKGGRTQWDDHMITLNLVRHL